MADFSESLWLNYNKTVRNATRDNFNYLELGSNLNLAYVDDQESTSYIYKMRVYENHLGFLSDVDNAKSLKNSFRFEFIENCEVNYKKINNRFEISRLYQKRCCVGLKVNWPGDFSKKIDLCSLNKHDIICVVEIRNLEKTLVNNCRKFLANRKYYELNNGIKSQTNPFLCQNNTNSSNISNNSNGNSSTFTYNISNTSSVTNVSIKPIMITTNNINNSNSSLNLNKNGSSSNINNITNNISTTVSLVPISPTVN